MIMSFENQLKEYYANRSKYPHIRPEVDAKQWSVYVYGEEKKHFGKLSEALKWMLSKK